MSAPAVQASAPPGLPQIGQVLDGRFELLGVLGEGGMGHVFRAHDLRRGREVALKLITPRYLGRPERERRFLRELELGRRVEHHRSLPDYLGGGRLPPLRWPFVVMERVPGKDLASRLTRGPLPSPLAVRLARQVAGAVQTLHRAGVVHRDVTTMNVLVCEGEAVLIDLSHAGEVAAPDASRPERPRLTREHEVPGTHHFMPPEQARAEPAHPAMDVYAFGVMLVHMLTGVAPGGCGRDAFIELQREGRLPSPRIDTRVYTEVPLALAELVDACVAPEPERRPTIDEVVRRLDELLVVMTASVETDEPLRAANEGGEVVRGASRPWWALVTAVIVLLFVVGAWRWSNESEAEPAAVREQPRPPARSSTPAMIEPRAEPSVTTPEPEAASGSKPPAPIEHTEPTAPRATPKPKPKKRRERPSRAKPRPSPPPEPPAAEPCDDVRARATAARRARHWSQVVQLTASPRCWDDPAARVRLRIKALSELGRHADCVKLGQTSSDPEVKRLATHCARQSQREAP